ncbi:MAG: hypothetical protein V2B17_06660, partial [Chloroflexota bacterium]
MDIAIGRFVDDDLAARLPNSSLFAHVFSLRLAGFNSAQASGVAFEILATIASTAAVASVTSASGLLLQALKGRESLAQLGNLDLPQIALRQHTVLSARLDRLVDELLAHVGGDGIADGASRGRDPEAFEPRE